MILLDANIILRYLLNDHEEMALQAEKYILEENAAVTTEVVAEVVYVLKRVYSVDRAETAAVISKFLHMVNSSEAEILQEGLRTYADTTLDFVDCLLYAYHKINGYEIRTFDKKLAKQLKHG